MTGGKIIVVKTKPPDYKQKLAHSLGQYQISIIFTFIYIYFTIVPFEKTSTRKNVLTSLLAQTQTREYKSIKLCFTCN